jgi:glycosyltransferase involved in cell wall biosynthesis
MIYTRLLSFISMICIAFCSFAEEKECSTSHKARVLVGSPIRQKPSILKEFLESLDRQAQKAYTLEFFFVDDNVEDDSHSLLSKFQKDHTTLCHIEGPENDWTSSAYVCTETTHNWKDEIIWKVASFKDRIIGKARNEGYDYLFLIDSDIVLHPDTIDQLILSGKDIVSNAFWTKWSPEAQPMPAVWISDEYTLYSIADGEQISGEERDRRCNEFISQLKVPGVYPVGGLGACTLISKHALQAGACFKKLPHLRFWGEDRHFCVRAASLGLSMYCDTHLPACHIYRESLLPYVAHYKWACENNAALPLIPSPRITLSMVVKNEADKFLKRILEGARKYITDAVIIDDASTDNSVQICTEVLQGIPLKIVHNGESKFFNEITLRKQQWEETIKTHPDWIVVLDADEVFEEEIARQIENMVIDSDVDAYSFRRYDFWDEEHYREDCFWKAHQRYETFLFRYKPEVQYVWKETPCHCGRIPLTVFEFRTKQSPLRLKHYGWATLEARLAKYHRYQLHDPGAKYGWAAQYESILDPNPNLVQWKE